MKRLPEYLICLWIVLTINFFLPRAIPGSAFSYLESDSYSDSQVVISPEWKKRLVSYYGLNKTLFGQYILYIKNIFSFNFGFSIYFKGPVSDLISQTLPWTLYLSASSILISSFIGIAAGLISAWKQGLIDKSLEITILVFFAVPPFVLGVIVQIIFCIYWKLFPLSGSTSVFFEKISLLTWISDVFYHSVLPVTVLTLSLVGESYFLTRTCTRDVMGEEYILFAKAKGLSDIRVIFKHTLRNAILPVITQISLRVAYVITGTIFIETIFSYPGMGKLIFDAILVHDYPVLQAIFFMFTLFALGANLLADLIYPLIDPRMKEVK